MPCSHKFFGHPGHLLGVQGLLPSWPSETLIIGTFNPNRAWAPGNPSNYFYGRPRNHFWNILPKFACQPAINRLNTVGQIEFLRKHRIALTDLLVSIQDADITNPQHVAWVRSYLDNDLTNFNDFIWNTENIIEFIQDRTIKAVYFTKMGNGLPFGPQMTSVENFCNANNILNFRLHTPSGMGLGPGAPRVNVLISRWYQQGANNFPFLCPNFNINNFPFAY